MTERSGVPEGLVDGPLLCPFCLLLPFLPYFLVLVSPISFKYLLRSSFDYFLLLFYHFLDFPTICSLSSVLFNTSFLLLLSLFFIITPYSCF